MRVFFFICTVMAVLGAGSKAWGHGEDQPGPHGGSIRMPGAYHTELKLRSSSSFDLYLLDMEWKNPVVVNSSVKAILKRKGLADKEIPCQVIASAFRCEAEKGTKWASGDEIAVIAVRQGMSGGIVLYSHPFLPPKGKPSKVSKPSGGTDEHQHHGH